MWALPFLKVLAPSKCYAKDRKRRHKKMTDWGRQMIRQVRRWLPGRYLMVVADSSYAVLERFSCAAGLREPVTVVTRLRLDAALYDPASQRKPGSNRLYWLLGISVLKSGGKQSLRKPSRHVAYVRMARKRN